MNAIIILSPHPLERDFAARLGSLPGLRSSEEGEGWVVQDQGSRVYLRREARLLEDYEAPELRQVLEMIGEPIPYSLEYSDIALCRRVLSAIADSPALVVDNDHGWIARGDRFVARLREHPEWDWRIRAPEVGL